MHQSMILCKGKTAKRVKILGLLQNYIESSFQKLLEETTIAELGDLISNYRNEATHERSFDKQELEFVRSKIIELLNMILCLRVV